MARQKKQEFTLTASGFEYDKDLSRVTIKVFPALQALIANQHELVEMAEKSAPDQFIFLESHRAELTEVEEAVAKAYADYCMKKEESKKKRKEKEENALNRPVAPAEQVEPLSGRFEESRFDGRLLQDAPEVVGTGLPSQKFTPREPAPARKDETDIRRIAIGAAIKALSGLLGRSLTEQEISVIEQQVDSYL